MTTRGTIAQLMGLLALGGGVGRAETPAASSQAPPSTTAPLPAAPLLAPRRASLGLEAGFSGGAFALEGEAATSWGLVVGLGVHVDSNVPPSLSGRLAYDLSLDRLRRHHIRAGLKVYKLDEVDRDAGCGPCTLLVPEIGYRYTSPGGFTFEVDEPLFGRITLDRWRKDGLGPAYASDGYNTFLVSILLGFRHEL